jgi:hypothetical protein
MGGRMPMHTPAKDATCPSGSGSRATVACVTTGDSAVEVAACISASVAGGRDASNNSVYDSRLSCARVYCRRVMQRAGLALPRLPSWKVALQVSTHTHDDLDGSWLGSLVVLTLLLLVDCPTKSAVVLAIARIHTARRMVLAV